LSEIDLSNGREQPIKLFGNPPNVFQSWAVLRIPAFISRFITKKQALVWIDKRAQAFQLCQQHSAYTHFSLLTYVHRPLALVHNHINPS
jgi:hypothetical protein